MNTNLQLKKEVLFLVSLPEEKIQEKGSNNRTFLNKIRNHPHVAYHDTISEELISTAASFRIVVIVGHSLGEQIQMHDGSWFPLKNIAESLPPSFDGVIHVAVCGAACIKPALEQKCPNSEVEAPEEGTQLALRLLIYSILLGRNDLNKDNFTLLYKDIRTRILEAQQSLKNPEELAKLPWATTLGGESEEEIKTSVYAPHYVFRGEIFPIKIVMHNDEDKGTLLIEIKKHDDSMAEREHNVVLNNIHCGDVLQLRISFIDGVKENTDLISVKDKKNILSIIINDKNEIDYDVLVSEKYPFEKFWMLLGFFKDGKQIKEMNQNVFHVKSEGYLYSSSTDKHPCNSGGLNPTEQPRTNYPSLSSEQEGEGEAPKTKEERVFYAMKKVVEANLIKKKQDWAAIHWVLIKNGIYSNLKKTDFVVHMLKSMDFPSEIMEKIVPKSSSSLDKILIKDKMKSILIFSSDQDEPKEMSYGEMKRLRDLAKRFMEFYDLMSTRR